MTGSIFLRYIDSNYVNILSMKPEQVRRSLLGAIRFGKPLIIDISEFDLWHQLPQLLDQVHPGLFQAILSKDILKEEVYKLLIKDSDGEVYGINNFQEDRLGAFKFILVTASKFMNKEAIDKLYTFRVQLRE